MLNFVRHINVLHLICIHCVLHLIFTKKTDFKILIPIPVNKVPVTLNLIENEPYIGRMICVEEIEINDP